MISRLFILLFPSPEDLIIIPLYSLLHIGFVLQHQTTKMLTDTGPESKRGGSLEIEHDEKSAKGEAVVSGDYSGAGEKTDPVEIALVRKLDRRIMVSHCILQALKCKNY